MPRIIFYRNNCIGCSICREMQPEVWRMSKKDGKAVLLRSIEKKKIYQLALHADMANHCREVANACPARIIKIA